MNNQSWLDDIGHIHAYLVTLPSTLLTTTRSKRGEHAARSRHVHVTYTSRTCHAHAHAHARAPRRGADAVPTPVRPQAMESRRAAEVEMVVSRLGAEMAQAEAAAKRSVEDERTALHERHAARDAELAELKVKYMRAFEANAELEARQNALSGELASAREAARAAAAEGEAARASLEASAFERADDAKRAAAAAEMREAKWAAERNGLAEELSQLRAEMRQADTAHSAALVEARSVKDAELLQARTPHRSEPHVSAHARMPPPCDRLPVSAPPQVEERVHHVTAM